MKLLLRIFVLSRSADCSLGRVPKESLHQNTLMELLIEGISNKEKLTENAENLGDISEWKGLVWNSGEKIIKIQWSNKELLGSIELQWLPPSIEHFGISLNQLSGSLDLTCLPDQLEACDAGDNALSGSLVLDNLPNFLRRLDVRKNNFTETVCLRNLPPKMELLYLQTNLLTGSLDLTCLPMSLQSLSLHTNRFEGKVDFSHLPSNLTYANVSNNFKLSGTLGREMRWLYTDNTMIVS